MQFDNTQPIWAQIYELLLTHIADGEWREGERIASVRELGGALAVNPNTVMRSYEKLTSEGIIYNRRGIGYFTSPDARVKVLEAQKEQFLNEELPMMIKKMRLLEISEDELVRAFRQTHATV